MSTKAEQLLVESLTLSPLAALTARKYVNQSLTEQTKTPSFELIRLRKSDLSARNIKRHPV